MPFKLRVQTEEKITRSAEATATPPTKMHSSLEGGTLKIVEWTYDLPA
jgi:hypothetical protein